MELLPEELLSSSISVLGPRAVLRGPVGAQWALQEWVQSPLTGWQDSQLLLYLRVWYCPTAGCKSCSSYAAFLTCNNTGHFPCVERLG